MASWTRPGDPAGPANPGPAEPETEVVGKPEPRRPVPPLPRWVVPAGLIVLVLALVGVLVAVLNGASSVVTAAPRCTATAPPDSPGLRSSWRGSAEQMDNAATIAGIGRRIGAPDRAITIAIATAIQESGLANLRGGDRDSLGLFQQRPSQGWGTEDQILDTDYATTAFYDALLAIPGWQTLDVTQAAQRVQRSGFPEAYADHEPEARTLAVVFLGQNPGGLTCTDLDFSGAASDDVAALARTELGTAKLSGPQSATTGWAIASWLVGHSTRLAVDRVTFDGRTWTADSGTWAQTGAADGVLALHRLADG